MVKEAIGVGETILEAQENAFKILGVEDTEKCKIDVLQMPEKKKFGLFGGNPAKVRVYLEQTAGEIALDYLKEVIDLMGINDMTFELTKEDEEGAFISIEGEQAGIIIGKRGETLDSLQYLAGLVANQKRDSYFRITINTGDYREKRETTLENLGKKLAYKAIKTRKNVVLEYMNPYERRIIHTAVQKVNGAISWSEGENINRHVVIGVDPNFKRRDNKNGYKKNGYNKGGYNKGGYKGGYNKNASKNDKNGYNKYNKNSSSNYNNRKTADTSFEKDARTPKNEGENLSLYGRIETTKKDDSSILDY